MRVILFDRSEIVVSEAEAERIAQAIQRDAKLINIHGEYVKPTAILAIKKGGLKPPTAPQLPERVEMTEEQREAARQKLEQIKREFFEKRK